MKNDKLRLASLALAGALFLAGCGNGGGTFATVNGEKISQEKYDSQLDLYKNMVAAQYQLPASIKNSLIQEEVMMQDLKKNNIELKDEDFAVEYEKTVENYGGAANYGQTLKALGITDQQLKDSLRYETISRKHKEMFDAQNLPTDEELQKYFDENKEQLIKVDASHILVNTKEEAEKAKKRIDDGEAFEDVAKEMSQDTGSAASGGQLQEAAPSSYVAEFANAVSTLEVGKVSDPVQSQFGYHIIRVNSRKDTVDTLKEDIIAAINTPKYQEYVQKLVADAEVQVAGETSESTEASSAADASAESAESQESAASESGAVEASENSEK
ncbi:MAG: peptidylprolyl isomerase [Peptoniphilaceae bacterium]|nr:peptidylprolyl isomerase [Peptoniphilaceae bacterium]